MKKSCPEGDTCPMHNRISYREMDVAEPLLVDYCGNYAIITTLNGDDVERFKADFLANDGERASRYLTTSYWCGNEPLVADDVAFGLNSYLHNDWDRLEDIHNSIVHLYQMLGDAQ